MDRLVIAALLLAGCTKHGNTTHGQTGGACPTAAGVYVASYVQQEPGKGRSGWAVPLLAKPLESDAPDYASIDAATASAAGVPAAPTGTVWLATAGAAPCAAK